MFKNNILYKTCFSNFSIQNREIFKAPNTARLLAYVKVLLPSFLLNQLAVTHNVILLREIDRFAKLELSRRMTRTASWALSENQHGSICLGMLSNIVLSQGLFGSKHHTQIIFQNFIQTYTQGKKKRYFKNYGGFLEQLWPANQRFIFHSKVTVKNLTLVNRFSALSKYGTETHTFYPKGVDRASMAHFLL